MAEAEVPNVLVKEALPLPLVPLVVVVPLPAILKVQAPAGDTPQGFGPGAGDGKPRASPALPSW